MRPASPPMPIADAHREVLERLAKSGVAAHRDVQRARALLIAKACTRPPETPEGQRRERWTHRELGEAVGMSESKLM